MAKISVVQEGALTKCFRHEGEECRRCDGSGFRLRPVSAGCGTGARNLTAEMSAKSPEEVRALPLYCPGCNPRRRNAGAVLAGLERAGA